MSHVSKIELEVNDLDALAKAAKDCGLELVRDKKTINWYGRWVNDYHGTDAAYRHGIKPEDYGKCDHALVRPGAHAGSYEVGVVDKGDGSYVIYYDFYGDGHNITKRIGPNGSKLKQHYVKHKTTEVMARKGFNLAEETVTADGSVRLILRGRHQL